MEDSNKRVCPIFFSSRAVFGVMGVLVSVIFVSFIAPIIIRKLFIKVYGVLFIVCKSKKRDINAKR